MGENGPGPERVQSSPSRKPSISGNKKLPPRVNGRDSGKRVVLTVGLWVTSPLK